MPAGKISPNVTSYPNNSFIYNSPTFLLIEKLTKDQADMNAARSVRPLTAAANVNKNAVQSK
jgi:hypothetical protein